MNNESAIDFYKKFEFEIVETKEHYYKRIEPADAHVLQKNLKKKTDAASTTASLTALIDNLHVNGIESPPLANNVHSQQLQSKAKA